MILEEEIRNAEQGSIGAMCRIGDYYYQKIRNEGYENQYENMALKYYKMAAEREELYGMYRFIEIGNISAKVELSFAYQIGIQTATKRCEEVYSIAEKTLNFIEKYGSENVIALSIAYGQKHTKEIEASDKIVKYYNVEHIYLDLAKIFQYSDCSLLSHSDKEIPKESYNDQIKSTNGSPVSTYVPFRNGLFLSSAASIAISKGCSVIYYGAHADDAAGSAYPDCSSDFNNAINEAIYLGSGKQIKVVAPFINATKDQVVKKGLEINVPYKYTWSCYEGGEKPCGKCGTCIDRAKAFELNGIKDPAME